MRGKPQAREPCEVYQVGLPSAMGRAPLPSRSVVAHRPQVQVLPSSTAFQKSQA